MYQRISPCCLYGARCSSSRVCFAAPRIGQDSGPRLASKFVAPFLGPWSGRPSVHKLRAGRRQLTLIIQFFLRLVATCCEDAGFTVYWNKKREQHWNHWITPLGVLACSSGSVFASERDLGQALCGYHGNPDLAHKAWNTQVGLYDLYIPKSYNVL